MNKSNIGEILKVGFTLFAITAASAFILAFVNEITNPVITEKTIQAQIEANKSVLPDATDFSKIELNNCDEIVASVSKGTDSNNNTVGYAVSVLPKGYGGEISITVGVDNDNKVCGLEVISQSETAGLGARCTEKEFQERFIGKTEGLEIVKNNAKDNQVDAISSATITSKAVAKGVNAALNAVSNIKEVD